MLPPLREPTAPMKPQPSARAHQTGRTWISLAYRDVPSRQLLSVAPPS